MPKEIMRRTAADNAYLHKDFHGALSEGLEFLHNRYGPDAVREYLRRFADEFYAPLKKALKEKGLVAVRDHYEKIYKLEEGKATFTLSDGELVIDVAESPAVTHMRKNGYTVARLFHETIKTVNETICEGTDFAFELQSYDPATGKSRQRFYRRAGK